MNDLVLLVKRCTNLFTNEQIVNKIKQLNNIETHTITRLDVLHSLYKDKGFFTKEEYASEIMYYLYTNSTDSKNKVDSVVSENKNWFYDQYNNAINNKKSFYYAVYWTRSALMSFLHEKEFPIDDDLEDLEDDVLN